MTRILKSLLGSKRQEQTPEEIEQLARATFVLRCRVERIMDGKAAI